MVQEICRDIKKLYFAKKHITTTITALHRLTMLGAEKSRPANNIRRFQQTWVWDLKLPIATSAVQVIPEATPAPSPMISQPSSALIASREDVLTRAAALGRGAATTGFKRFLALTEAAKDCSTVLMDHLENSSNA
ncbi:membrane trafficking VPS53 family protein [Artemisia annua]|uniref:Membrane trafficking VPS53 family protein n=1 Tax=Artemisia annua TaxID=35608 RepID=A0A2U1NIZ3_ARTAN|nr:membrane trafficking VPS53 family protein [Artemisia annua]